MSGALAYSPPQPAQRERDSAKPQLRRGGCAAKKSCEATLARADGVVLVKRMISLLTSTTPAAAFIEASPYRARASRASAFPSLALEELLSGRRLFPSSAEEGWLRHQ